MTRPQDITLESSWEAFSKVAITAHAPQVQREAMYQAFLAGVDTLAQVYQAAVQHTPTGVKNLMAAWEVRVQGELKRLAQETRN